MYISYFIFKYQGKIFLTKLSEKRGTLNYVKQCDLDRKDETDFFNRNLYSQSININGSRQGRLVVQGVCCSIEGSRLVIRFYVIIKNNTLVYFNKVSVNGRNIKVYE